MYVSICIELIKVNQVIQDWQALVLQKGCAQNVRANDLAEAKFTCNIYLFVTVP